MKCTQCGKSKMFHNMFYKDTCKECFAKIHGDLKAENKKMSNYIKDLRDNFPSEIFTIKECQDQIVELRGTIEERVAAIQSLDREIQQKQKESLEIDDDIMLQSYGIYEPKYDFVNSLQYKEKLDGIRSAQKNLIKSGYATSGGDNWAVNGSKAAGTAMANAAKKMLLRAYNMECDMMIDKVKYNNYKTYSDRIFACEETISQLGEKIAGISIAPVYSNFKIQELNLAFEYQQKKQEEKEEQRRIREEEREQTKLVKEIEEARKNVNKDKTHYEKALDKVKSQLENSKISAEEKVLLNEKYDEYISKIEELEKELKQIDYREANQKAGYVYVISNIGSFGKDVYKIGMTRRLDPMERVYELGDASVPFNFDVHAMIFSNDAPALEARLHKEFEDKKVNMINHRREFFNVNLDEIKKVIYDSIDKTVDIIDNPEAEQYYQTLALKTPRT
jgi:Uncharacterized conserved protein